MKGFKRFRREMPCGEVMEVLQAYLDGEVDSQAARQVAVHLNRCPPCERESFVYQRIKATFIRRRAELDPAVAAALADYVARLSRDEVS